MKKRSKKKTTIENATGIAAADYSPNRAWLNFPILGSAPECSEWALERVWRRARSLYANSPEVRYAVNTLATMAGTITPRPCSGNEEWDAKAREAFLRRANNPALFDAAGQMAFNQMQLWIEKRAIIDGDSLSVLTSAKDGGGCIQLYSAPQITGNGKFDDGYKSGVMTDDNGRPKAYMLYDFARDKSYKMAANRAILYRHNPDPSTPRGASELIAAICTA